MERLRIRFLYRRGDVVGYGPQRTPCTVLSQRYTALEGLGQLHEYYVTDEDGYWWTGEADLVPLREHLS